MPAKLTALFQWKTPAKNLEGSHTLSAVSSDSLLLTKEWVFARIKQAEKDVTRFCGDYVPLEPKSHE